MIVLENAIQHLQNDEKLKPIIHTTELDIPSFNQDVYYVLVNSIVSQQLSVKAAATIFSRFLKLFSDAYPHTREVLELDTETLRGVGLSRSKADYIQNVADFFQENKLFNIDWSALDNDEIIDMLTKIKGVGVWTVEMILMFALQRPDVFPVGDLGIQKAMIKCYDIPPMSKRELRTVLEKIARKWSPYRSVACLYLWQWRDE